MSQCPLSVCLSLSHTHTHAHIQSHTHIPVHTHTLPHVQIVHAWDIIMQLMIRARLESLREALRGALLAVGSRAWWFCVGPLHNLSSWPG